MSIEDFFNSSFTISNCFGPVAQTIWYFWFNFSFKIPTTASFIFCAPWLPPNIKTIGNFPDNPNSFSILLFCSLENSLFWIFTGVPVKTIFLALCILSLASSNDINTTSAFFARNFTAFPGKALLSCNATGIFSFLAAHTTGPQIYPPAPITTSGLNSFIIFFASPYPLNVLYILFIFSIEIFLLSTYASIVFNS